ncbi:MAG: hypothetical protein K2P38_17135 [Lachnospiraceae bacterium]|nr:hypothetical protein [Lachnospiraceae bacterium]
MSFENLLSNYSKLIKHMEDHGYAKSYIRLLKTEINWLRKNGDLADSYEGHAPFVKSSPIPWKCDAVTDWNTASSNDLTLMESIRITG